MKGVVAAGDPQSAEAGARMLREGGNAVDAAVATAFAAFVCELPLCSPLGGGAMLVELPGGAAHAIDMFARAPSGPKTNMDFHDVTVSFRVVEQVFHVGRAAAAVPLALPGLLEAHRRWGTRPLADVVAPAVTLAKQGWTLGPGVGFVFRVLEPIANVTPACRALYCVRGGSEMANVGDVLVNPDLGAALEDLANKPSFLADLFAAFAREFGPAQGGLVTETDVANARIAEHAPVHVNRGDWELATMPSPSTGGRLVARGLELHAGDGTKHAFLSEEHLLRVARVQEMLLAERASENELGSTTHISAIDERGTAVSLTLTNGEGCGHVVAGTGMIVNNLLGEEDIHPRGFHKDPPGAPLATMMAPTILRNGAKRIALGSGGSNRLRNAILQVLVAMLEHGVDVKTAVAAPRIQIERDIGRYRAAFEDVGLDRSVAAALSARYPDACRLFTELNLYFGGVHVAIANGDGTFAGAGDPRRGGAVSIA